ncbi:hypothetical protein BC939DRAFT_35135 [Gamsiella multidivaricata]|uniref:uncharacterized protein n=1 Tax=Gamsiella multidivaricata TaxID=101098 RepID=UPI00221EF6AB|nr:uncharacterized protein BC939DRAFT_35135 [Gamsiella multidivaricata]KAI7816625.1 hypothetical protein BC939DRAFT_35135 [Gamsiella multidivaricata]
MSTQQTQQSQQFPNGGGKVIVFRMEQPQRKRQQQSKRKAPKETTSSTPAKRKPNPTQTQRAERSAMTPTASISQESLPHRPISSMTEQELAQARKDSANEVLRSILEMNPVSSTIRLYRTHLRVWKVRAFTCVCIFFLFMSEVCTGYGGHTCKQSHISYGRAWWSSH